MLRPRFLKARQRLDQKITIQRSAQAKNEFNEPTGTDWADVFSTRAAAYPAPGFEKVVGEQNTATIPITFEVRAETRTRAILPSDRIRWDSNGGQILNIIAPVMQPERGNNIQIQTAADRT